MNKEQYLKNKEEIKFMSTQLKTLKYAVREVNREYSKNTNKYPELMEAILNYKGLKQQFRIKHVFMSLVRGHERNQIENKHAMNYSIERGIQKLCDEYNFKAEYDMEGCVSKVLPIEGEATIVFENAS